MNTSKIMILLSFAVISLSLMLFLIQFLLGRKKLIGLPSDKEGITYGIWFSGLFLSASMICWKAIYLFSETLDMIFRTAIRTPAWELIKTGSLFIGFSVFWFLLILFITRFLSFMLFGKRSLNKELEAANSVYFIFMSLLLLGISLVFLIIFENTLRLFMPSIQIPFYH